MKSGHNLQEVLEEINHRTKLWTNGEKKRLENMKKVETDEWDIVDDGNDDGCDNESASNRFLHLYYLGPHDKGVRTHHYGAAAKTNPWMQVQNGLAAVQA